VTASWTSKIYRNGALSSTPADGLYRRLPEASSVRDIADSYLCDEWRSTEATSRRSQSVDPAVGREAKRVAVRGPRAAAGPAVAAGGKISHEDCTREGGRTLNIRWVHAADGGFECSF